MDGEDSIECIDLGNEEEQRVGGKRYFENDTETEPVKYVSLNKDSQVYFHEVENHQGRDESNSEMTLCVVVRERSVIQRLRGKERFLLFLQTFHDEREREEKKVKCSYELIFVAQHDRKRNKMEIFDVAARTSDLTRKEQFGENGSVKEEQIIQNLVGSIEVCQNNRSKRKSFLMFDSFGGAGAIKFGSLPKTPSSPSSTKFNIEEVLPRVFSVVVGFRDVKSRSRNQEQEEQEQEQERNERIVEQQEEQEEQEQVHDRRGGGIDRKQMHGMEREKIKSKKICQEFETFDKILKNRMPVFNDNDGTYRLDFGGRALFGSVKNFQLEFAPDEPIMLQFGKVASNRFTMDFNRENLTMTTAFMICLSQFMY